MTSPALPGFPKTDDSTPPQVQTAGPAPRLSPCGASDPAVPAIAAALRAWVPDDDSKAGSMLCYVLGGVKCAHSRAGHVATYGLLHCVACCSLARPAANKPHSPLPLWLNRRSYSSESIAAAGTKALKARHRGVAEALLAALPKGEAGGPAPYEVYICQLEKEVRPCATLRPPARLFPAALGATRPQENLTAVTASIFRV